MSITIENALKTIYADKFENLARETQSTIFDKIPNKKEVQGEFFMYDIVGEIDKSTIKVGRKTGDVTANNTVVTKRRQLAVEVGVWSYYKSDEDVNRMAKDPRDEITVEVVSKFNRWKDEVVLENVFGTALEFENGIPKPIEFKAENIVGTADKSFTFADLTKLVARANKARLPMIGRKLFISPSLHSDFLQDPKFTSYDYVNTKTLENGTIGTFLGLEFILSEDVVDQGAAAMLVCGDKAILVGTRGKAGLEMGRDISRGNDWACIYTYSAGALRCDDDAVFKILSA